MEEMSLEQGLEEIGHKILVLTRNELYMKMRFMDVALSAFYYVQDFSVDLLATDGETMYFNGQMLGGEYRQNRIWVNRAYLHLVLHCIFRHVFRRNGREELVWNLAADIAVESVIDDWNLQNIRKSQSWIRQRTYRDLKEEIKVFTAEKIYGVLVRWKLSDREMERMAREFTVDDHKYWAKDEDDEKESKNLMKPLKNALPYISDFLKKTVKSLKVSKLENHLKFGLASYADTAQYIGYIWAVNGFIKTLYPVSKVSAEPVLGDPVIDFKGCLDVDINLLKLLLPVVSLISKKEIRILIKTFRGDKNEK